MSTIKAPMGAPNPVYASFSKAPTSFESPTQALLAYLGAFNAKDADFIGSIVKDNSLVEVPMLKPNRLFGTHEIRKGHAEAFKTIANAEFAVSEPVENGATAIAEGSLTVKRMNGDIEEHTLGVVAELNGGDLQRVSLYINARHFRLWSDKTIV